MDESMRSSSCPARPTKGLPCRSSSRPGASPISIMRARSLPRAKHRLFAVRLSEQPSKLATKASSSARVQTSAPSFRAVGSLAIFAVTRRGATVSTLLGAGSRRAAGEAFSAKQFSGSSPIASSAPMAWYQSSKARAAFSSAADIVHSLLPRLPRCPRCVIAWLDWAIQYSRVLA